MPLRFHLCSTSNINKINAWKFQKNFTESLFWSAKIKCSFFPFFFCCLKMKTFKCVNLSFKVSFLSCQSKHYYTLYRPPLNTILCVPYLFLSPFSSAFFLYSLTGNFTFDHWSPSWKNKQMGCLEVLILHLYSF